MPSGKLLPLVSHIPWIERRNRRSWIIIEALLVSLVMALPGGMLTALLRSSESWLHLLVIPTLIAIILAIYGPLIRE
jgi:hypothetical protein